MGRGQVGIRWVGGVWMNPDGMPAHNKDGSIPAPPRPRKPTKARACVPPPPPAADLMGILGGWVAATRAIQGELHHIARLLEKPIVVVNPAMVRKLP